MKIEFEPNITPKQPIRPEWATYIPDRWPEFKIHTQRGHALNAAHNRDNYILYHWEDDKWVEVTRFEDFYTRSNCYGCGIEFNKSNYSGYKYYGSYNKWVDKKTNPHFERFCRTCYYSKEN